MINFDKSNKDSWLGTFSDHAVTIDNHEWKTAEHYFQAQRYILFPQIYEDIKKAETKESAYFIALQMLPLTECSWNSNRKVVMKKIMRAKFDQHKDLKQKLIDTKKEDLFSSATSSPFWSVGVDGQGKNNLGIIVMSLRKEYQEL